MRPLLAWLQRVASVGLAACAGCATVEWLGSPPGPWGGAFCASIFVLAATLSGAVARRRQAREDADFAMLSTALEHMSNGLVCFDARERLVLSNRRYREIFGLGETRLRRGMARAEVVDAIGEANGWPIERRQGLLRRQQEWNRTDTSEPVHLVMDDGRNISIRIRLIEGGGVVTTFDDVTKEHEAQRRIVELAFRDPLTKLPNRRSLQQRLEDLYRAQRDFRLLLLDLDHFKSVNDTYGHGVGDKLLVQVAERLGELLGPEGFAARLGGDEIALIVFGGERAAAALAEAVIRSLDQPFAIDDLTISIGCSIGECGSIDARDASGLMQFADIALYESKRGGRGRSSSYCAGMVETIAERARLEADMRLAIERDEFHLVYQPILALGDDRLIGYEALIRWRHPTLGLVSPAAFIPLAEENGQIVAIGAWVLREACRQAASLPGDLHVAVNVSAAQFRTPLLLAHLTQALAESGLPAQRLEIELTETAMVEDMATIAGTLGAIRQLGVKVAMDDFGTGYSSLTHLRDLPLDRIKIDRSFIANVETDRHSRAVLRGLAQIAREMGIAIQAEGVETPSQLTLLREIGCDAAQGYLLGKPLPLEDAEGIRRSAG